MKKIILPTGGSVRVARLTRLDGYLSQLDCQVNQVDHKPFWLWCDLIVYPIYKGVVL